MLNCNRTIVSWNVNGCRSGLFEKKITRTSQLCEILPGNFKTMIDKYNPDLVCLQETRCGTELGEYIFKCKEYPYKFWNQSEGEGARGRDRYSGTCIWCKHEPISVHFNYMNLDDKEGRFIMIEYEEYIVINVYTPNSGTNFKYRVDIWDQKIKEILDSVNNKPLIMTGDFNVVSQTNDIWHSTPLIKGNSPGVHKQERDMFNKYLEHYCDVFRYLYPNEKKWTWWDMRTRGRDKDRGWRIDYFLIHKKHKNLINDCIIDNTIMGSDHCPVILKIKF